MLAIDGTFLVIFISFLVFMFLMNTLYFAPILKVKHVREETLESGRRAAEDATQKRLLLAQEYEQHLAQARHKAHQLVQEKREWAKTSAAERVSSTRESALSEVERQSASLKQTRDKVYESLLPQRDTLAKLVVGKISEQQSSKETSTLAI